MKSLSLTPRSKNDLSKKCQLVSVVLAFLVSAACAPQPIVIVQGTRIEAPDFMLDKCGSMHRAAKDMPLHVSIPSDADPDFDHVMSYSIAWWQKNVPNLVVYDGVSDRPDDSTHIGLTFVDVPLDKLAILGETTGGVDQNTCTLHDSHITINFIHPGTDDNHLNSEIISHEIGHALGLGHDMTTTSLMFPSAHIDPILLPETKHELIYIYGDIEMVTPAR